MNYPSITGSVTDAAIKDANQVANDQIFTDQIVSAFLNRNVEDARPKTNYFPEYCNMWMTIIGDYESICD